MSNKQTKLFRVGVRAAADHPPTEHLVRAHSLSQAKEHVTRDMIKGEVASQEDILRLVKAGVEVTDATIQPADRTPAVKTSAKK